MAVFDLVFVKIASSIEVEVIVVKTKENPAQFSCAGHLARWKSGDETTGTTFLLSHVLLPSFYPNNLFVEDFRELHAFSVMLDGALGKT